MRESTAPAGPFLYVVACQFDEEASGVAQAWLDWLRQRHLQEVLDAGALSAEILQLSADPPHFEIHYRFASAEDFARYERDEAPRLKADGLARFPLELGLNYQRRTGHQRAYHFAGG